MIYAAYIRRCGMQTCDCKAHRSTIENGSITDRASMTVPFEKEQQNDTEELRIPGISQR